MTSVMVDGRYLGAKPSGIGRYCQQVIGAMQTQRPALGWRFVLRKLGDATPLHSEDAVIYNHQAYGPQTSLGLPRQLGPRPADLFHSPFHVLPRGLNCPTVLTMHDVFNFTQPNTSNHSFPVSWVEWAYFLMAIPQSLRAATRIICVSQTTADALVQHAPYCRDKIRVIHHGVTATFHMQQDREAVARQCRALVGERPFLLSVGAVSPNKNQTAMMRAFALAFPNGRGPNFVTISRFGDIGKLQSQAHKFGIADHHVALAGPSDAQVLVLLNGALGLAFYSLVEGFGLPILEAMACGCPVLTSSRSCMPEVAGQAALLADPYDIATMASQMAQLYHNEALRQELRGKGLAHAAKFSWQRAAELHLQVYDEALG